MTRARVRPDLVLRLLAQGYDAVERDRAARCGPGDDPDAYLSRMAGRRALVVRGEEGARFFYDARVARRKHAVPFPLAGLLFGRGALHGLDDAEHEQHKRLFLDVLGPQRASSLVRTVADELARSAPGWAAGDDPGAVFDRCVEVYGRAVLGWAGTGSTDEEAVTTSHLLAQVVDGFGFAPSAYLRAWVARLRADRCATGLVREVRDGRRTPPPGSALAAFAGADLGDHVAGVELLDVLRTTVAVAWFATWLAAALEEHPDWRARLATGEVGPDHTAFVHEVRRTSPFVPALAAKVRLPASHAGTALRPGERIVLDVWGTGHVATRFPDPGRFRPERWLERPPGLFDFVPQGGGTPLGHRCPGEPVTVALLAETARALALTDVRVEVTRQAGRQRMPTRPEVRVRQRQRGRSSCARSQPPRSAAAS